MVPFTKKHPTAGLTVPFPASEDFIKGRIDMKQLSLAAGYSTECIDVAYTLNTLIWNI